MHLWNALGYASSFIIDGYEWEVMIFTHLGQKQ